MEKETFRLYHNNPNVKTLEEFCQVSGVHFDSDSSKRSDKYQLNDFFEDNRQNILDQMDTSQRVDYIKEKGLNKKVEDLKAEDLDIKMTLPCPLTLVIAKRLVTYTMSAKHTNLQEPMFDVVAFEDAQIRSSLLEDNIRFSLAPFVKKERPTCSVIGFFKTLYYNKMQNGGGADNGEGIYQLKSNFTDISDFVFQLSTSVGQQGGNFSISLPHVPFYHSGGMGATKQSVNQYMDTDSLSNDLHAINGDDRYSVVKSGLNNMDYFNWLISPNDLIFISFDEIDKDSVHDDCIAGNSFDMIGLVDTVTLTRDSSGNITVNVSGRDLMKLISDDSTIFFPNATAVDKGNFFDNVEGALRTGDLGGVITVNGQTADKTNSKNDNVMRMPSTGSVELFNEECNGFSIDYIIKVVIRELSNMQICPSEIFGSWKDRRTKFAYLTPTQKTD